MTGLLWRAGASRPRRRKVYDSATMAQAIALVAGPMVNPRCKNQDFCRFPLTQCLQEVIVCKRYDRNEPAKPPPGIRPRQHLWADARRSAPTVARPKSTARRPAARRPAAPDCAALSTSLPRATAVIEPPMASTKPRQIARPSPVPARRFQCSSHSPCQQIQPAFNMGGRRQD